ncbi:MAG TPA: hypothetical protein VK186_19375 [Candidatus Deferrimicrobium sp.]|nr:hypothetical protein [Candidatus Deferrimicrobium sp.]
MRLHKDISSLHKDFLRHSNLPGPDTTITKSGGKNGQFDIQALLKDSLNKIVLQKQYP